VRPQPLIAAALEGQRGYLFPWVPVLLGAGIGLYFALRVEPPPWMWWSALALQAVLLAAAVRARGAAPWLLAPVILLAGAELAVLRTHAVAAPVLGFRYYGPIEGRIVNIDRSVSDRLRLTLDRVVLERVAPDRTPAHVRVALHGDQGFVTPEPGMVVILTGHLAAPEGPVAPGGYDFRRQAWFDGLGAVGYTRTPVLMLEPLQPSADLFFARLRLRLSASIQADLPGQQGALAATLITGDRSGLTRQTQDALRNSNLSHILSISGLHMVLLCGAVFGMIRFGLALVPPLALRLPIRKIAAVAAIAAGLFYYLLSGREVPAERAWVMISVMFVAVLFDRRAISLRSVAIAAVLVMALRPESLTEPGFQMSFAATVALVAAFAALRQAPKLPGWVAPAATVVLSSAVAGAATAPFAAAHFNRVADYGLVANLLCVPLMGVTVMPAALLAGALAPFGLGWVGLTLMDLPLRWVLFVAHAVSSAEGAVTRVPAPPGLVLPLLAMGGLFLVLWQGPLRVRSAGLVPVLAAAALWATAERPALLISGEGALLGLMTEHGRALSKPRGQGFAALSWLEDDGDGALQPVAAERAGFVRDKGEVRAEVAGLTVRQFSGRGAAERAKAACGGDDLLILAAEAPGDLPAGCRLIDERLLAATGPMALSGKGGAPVLDWVRRRTGDRPWMRALPPAVWPVGGLPGGPGGARAGP
jgi:competence protein ComEC